MKASQVVFQQLLNGKIQYVIPLYQRTYSWTENQWEQLWIDLLEVYDMPEPRNHFIGSVVTQQIGVTSPEGTRKYTLIDGQQRMTTLFILLSVVREQAEQIDGSLYSEILENSLINKFVNEEDRIKLMPTQADRDSFASVVDGKSPEPGTQIEKARKFFMKVLGDKDASGNEIDLRKLYRSIVQHLDMVSILLEGDDSPNRIFESLNNTGMPLSVADLIRNYLLMNITDPRHQGEAYKEYWYPMQQSLMNESRDDMGDFFWRYLMMDGSLTRKDDTYDEIRKRLKSPTPDEVVDKMKEFLKFSDYYAQITEKKCSDINIKEQIQRLNQWEVEVAYPFLMTAFDGLASNRISAEQLVSVMRMIESFVVRRTVCGVPTNQLRRIFAQLSGQVHTDTIIESTRTYLSENRWPSDDEFRSRFVDFRLYVPARLRRTRLVLYSLERSFGHKEIPELNSNITIEHIMPQTLSPEWRSAIGPSAAEIHDQWVDTVGNLTLTGYNPNMGNKPFAEKKSSFAQSKFSLSESLRDVSKWDEDAIQSRGNEMADRALLIWRRD